MVRCCDSGRKINDLLPAIIIWCLWLLFSRQCVSWLFWAANLIRSFIQVWPSLWYLWLIREKKSSIVDCTCVYTFNITSLPALCNFSRGVRFYDFYVDFLLTTESGGSLVLRPSSQLLCTERHGEKLGGARGWGQGWGYICNITFFSSLYRIVLCSNLVRLQALLGSPMTAANHWNVQTIGRALS